MSNEKITRIGGMQMYFKSDMNRSWNIQDYYLCDTL